MEKMCPTTEAIHQLQTISAINQLIDITANSSGGEMPIDYRNTVIKTVVDTTQYSVPAGAVLRVVMDLGSDWESYQFCSHRGLAITGVTGSSKGNLLNTGYRFSSTTDISTITGLAYVSTGVTYPCIDYNANTPEGYRAIGSNTGISAQWESTSYAYASGNNNLVIKGRYLWYVYQNKDTATHTITHSAATLHNLAQ